MIGPDTFLDSNAPAVYSRDNLEFNPERKLPDAVSAAKAVVETAAAQIAEFRRKTVAESAEKTRLSAEQTESLHALVYMGPDSAPVNDSNADGGADPKQKIAIANLLYDAMVYTENEKYQERCPYWSRF
jgi:hypothetical protein